MKFELAERINLPLAVYKFMGASQIDNDSSHKTIMEKMRKKKRSMIPFICDNSKDDLKSIILFMAMSAGYETYIAMNKILYFSFLDCLKRRGQFDFSWLHFVFSVVILWKNNFFFFCLASPSTVLQRLMATPQSSNLLVLVWSVAAYFVQFFFYFTFSFYKFLPITNHNFSLK